MGVAGFPHPDLPWGRFRTDGRRPRICSPSMPTPPRFPADLLSLAFDLAPVGLCVSRRRMIERCNATLASMFGYGSGELAGRSLSLLYPTHGEFERIGQRGLAVMRDSGLYSDERIMKHHDGHLFWCHVAGRSLDRDDPFECAVWMFEDLSQRRPVTATLTPREREVAQMLVEGKPTKVIARALGVSPRTIDAHRARLLRKLKVQSPAELIPRLAGFT